MASKLVTSRSSNAALGAKVARSTIEPTSPHRRRHERREREATNGIAIARNLFISRALSLLPLYLYLLSASRLSFGGSPRYSRASQPDTQRGARGWRWTSSRRR